MKISIITATFNSGKTLRDTLESIRLQTYQDIEAIVVDGGSKDNTLDIVREYESLLPGKLRWISEPDKGIYDAMNKGINMATGDIIGILNSDDFYTVDSVLETVAQQFEAHETDAIYGDVHYVSEDLLQRKRYYSSRLFRRGWMRFGFMPAHPSFYCRREVYFKYGLFNLSYRVAADFECLLRFIFVNNIKTRYVPLDFVTMRVGGASSSGFNSHKQIMKDHLIALRENGVFSNRIMLSLRYIYKILEVLLSKTYPIKGFFHIGK